jgi:hypothetical protein
MKIADIKQIKLKFMKYFTPIFEKESVISQLVRQFSLFVL